jgi:hypothetical protein
MKYAGLFPLLEAVLGIAVATYILFTAPTSRARRLVALVGVAMAAFAGAMVSLYWFMTAWLLPALTSIVFRQAWMRRKT